MYLACAEERAVERGSYGDAGERGAVLEEIDPARDELCSGLLISLLVLFLNMSV